MAKESAFFALFLEGELAQAHQKTIPGSLIAQGLSGLNDAKIQTFPHPASILTKKISFPLAKAKIAHLCPAKPRENGMARESAFFALFLVGEWIP